MLRHRSNNIAKRMAVSFLSLVASASELHLDDMSEWQTNTQTLQGSQILAAPLIGGGFDLMGNGGLILSKAEDTLFHRTTDFVESGTWSSSWLILEGAAPLASVHIQSLMYGHPIDISTGWIKFDGNPLLAGEGSNFIPSPENLTDQTILLPDPPGGCPQDQAIIRGTGDYEGKWLLLFNHTPEIWPASYHWSMAIADELEDFKHGQNPFELFLDQFPLYGPIDNHAPNDWIEVNGRYYAPDETYDLTPNMWISDDLLTWTNLGEIEGLIGHDPGIVFDGEIFHLFNENGNDITHCTLDSTLILAHDNETVMELGSHTGDADVSFFNNAWHMFYDNGEHLHYEIGYASTQNEDFPRGWVKQEKIYGPHNPEQGQVWDDDTEAGNLFGTGDADIAIEGNTLYMFTERPIGVAYKTLNELFDVDNDALQIRALSDQNGDGVPDDSSDWSFLNMGSVIWNLNTPLTGGNYRLQLNMASETLGQSPLIQSLSLQSDALQATKLELWSAHEVLHIRGDSLMNLTCKATDEHGNVVMDGPRNIIFDTQSLGNLQIGPTQDIERGIAFNSFAIDPSLASDVDLISIVASSPGLISDTIQVRVRHHLEIDDFEGYLNDDLLEVNWTPAPGLDAEITLFEQENNQILRYEYGVGNGSPPYSGIQRILTQDYGLAANVQFDYRGDASGRDLVLRLSENDGTDWDYTLSMMDSTWHTLTLSSEDFASDDGSLNIEFEKLIRLSFYVLPGASDFGTGGLHFDNILMGFQGLTGIVREGMQMPLSPKLFQNYPNPFNGSTQVKYFLTESGKVEFKVFDLLGRQVQKQIYFSQLPGSHQWSWTPGQTYSGIYFIQMTTGNSRQIIKTMLLK